VSTNPIPPRTAGSRLRAIVAGSSGNLVEWFDWYTYSATALYFAPVFFPKGDQTAQLLQAAAVFAVGFLARPIGAWLMGIYADRAGRRAAMTLSVAIMCVGTLIIAALPGAATIGVAAPAILVFARILQGLSLGGEYGASATYMSEVAGREHRGFWSSFNYVTLIGGQLLALGVLIVLQTILTPEQMDSWGWRVPFVIGAILAIAFLYLRMSMEESASYLSARASGAELASTRLLFTHYPREALTILALTAGGSLTFYVYTTYMQKFLTITAGFSKEQATEISAASLVVFMLVQPAFGYLSDKVGRKALLLFAYGGGAMLIWPIMTGIAAAGAPSLALAWIVTGILFQSGYTSVNAVFKAELFPANVRVLGVALPYALANAIFGGTAEYVALWFKSNGIEQGFYVYVATLLATGFIVVLTMPDTKRYSRIVED